MGKPVYRVRFVLEEDGLNGGPPTRRDVDIACSPQELEDLQASLREAVRAAEMVAGGGETTAAPRR